MIDLLDTMRTQDAVYWAPTTSPDGKVVPDEYGQPSFDQPVELKVMWIQKASLVAGPGGLQLTAGSKVFVGQDVREEGMMFKGKLQDVPAGLRNTPRKVFRAVKIIKFDSTPTIEGDQFVRVAYL